MSSGSRSYNRTGATSSDRRDRSGRSSPRGSAPVRRSSSGESRRSGASGGRRPVSRRQNLSMVLHDEPRVIDWICDVAKIVLVVIVIMFCISISGQAYEIGYSIFYEEAVDEEGYGTEIEVTITEDMSVAQIGSMLEEAGLLLDGSVFQYQELFSSYHGEITAGTYTLSTDMTPSEIIAELAENYAAETE